MPKTTKNNKVNLNIIKNKSKVKAKPKPRAKAKPRGQNKNGFNDNAINITIDQSKKTNPRQPTQPKIQQPVYIPPTHSQSVYIPPPPMYYQPPFNPQPQPNPQPTVSIIPPIAPTAPTLTAPVREQFTTANFDNREDDTFSVASQLTQSTYQSERPSYNYNTTQTPFTANTEPSPDYDNIRMMRNKTLSRDHQGEFKPRQLTFEQETQEQQPQIEYSPPPSIYDTFMPSLTGENIFKSSSTPIQFILNSPSTFDNDLKNVLQNKPSEFDTELKDINGNFFENKPPEPPKVEVIEEEEEDEELKQKKAAIERYKQKLEVEERQRRLEVKGVLDEMVGTIEDNEKLKVNPLLTIETIADEKEGEKAEPEQKKGKSTTQAVLKREELFKERNPEAYEAKQKKKELEEKIKLKQAEIKQSEEDEITTPTLALQTLNLRKQLFELQLERTNGDINTFSVIISYLEKNKDSSTVLNDKQRKTFTALLNTFGIPGPSGKKLKVSNAYKTIFDKDYNNTKLNKYGRPVTVPKISLNDLKMILNNSREKFVSKKDEPEQKGANIHTLKDIAQEDEIKIIAKGKKK